jgi:hypothetical protein
MAYYFECNECNIREIFNYTPDTYIMNNKVWCNEGKKQSYETVICKSCISKKVRLKGNYIIIK